MNVTAYFRLAVLVIGICLILPAYCKRDPVYILHGTKFLKRIPVEEVPVDRLLSMVNILPELLPEVLPTLLNKTTPYVVAKHVPYELFQTLKHEIKKQIPDSDLDMLDDVYAQIELDSLHI